MLGGFAGDRHSMRRCRLGADKCGIQPGDVIAVWGAGPVGRFAMASAFLLGGEWVIAIDRFPYRLAMARERSCSPPDPG